MNTAAAPTTSGPATDGATEASPSKTRGRAGGAGAASESTSGAPTATDGRVQRGIRTHSRIVESLLDLISEGSSEPTAHQIASAAGVSVRTIFQHFSDLEALYGDMIKAQTVRFTPLFESLDSEGDFESRLLALGVQRRELYELIMPIRRVIRRRGISSPAVTQRLTTVSIALREQVLRHFEPELGGEVSGESNGDEPKRGRPPGFDRAVDPDDVSNRQKVEALDLLWSFESWDRLRSTQELDPEQAEDLLVTLTRVLFAPRAG
ncbi:MAG: TetR/AcrR family transcriptional regulator [Microthrixaceae bacterium]